MMMIMMMIIIYASMILFNQMTGEMEICSN